MRPVSEIWGSYHLPLRPRRRARIWWETLTTAVLAASLLGLGHLRGEWPVRAETLLHRGIAWNYPLVRVEGEGRRLLQRVRHLAAPPAPPLSLSWPLFGPIHPAGRGPGIVISAGAGAEVRAAASGIVVRMAPGRPGEMLIISHPGGYRLVYGGLADLRVRRGERVRKGEVIGRVARVGPALRPGISLRLERNGREEDPLLRLGPPRA